MKRRPTVIPGLALAVTPVAAAVGNILLVARDLEEHPLPGLRFAYGGVESRPTDQAGATELDMPADVRTGEQIKIILVAGAKGAEDWFLVNPQVNIPIASKSAEVVLMSRRAFRQLAAAAIRPREQTAEDRKRALVEAAARRGLTAAQLETAIASFVETQDPRDRGIASYLNGQYAQAEELLSGVAKKRELDLIETLLDLGASQLEQAKYHSATESFRKAIALNGEDAVLLGWLAGSLYRLAEWTEAESLMRRALAIDEKSFGPEQPEVVTDLSNLAALLQATNRLAEAESLMRRALAIDEKSFGPGHPEAAVLLNNLAQLLQDTNRLAEAEPLMRRALAIDEKSFGKEHPNVANVLTNLAQLLQDTNRLAEAEPLMHRALAIDEKSFGPNHPRIATDLNNLAQLFKDTNRLAKAEPLMRRALAIDEKSFGPNHPKVAIRLNNLAHLLRRTNRFAEAEPMMRRALTIDERSFGQDHPDVAVRLNNLALLLLVTNRLAQAEPLMRRALVIFLDFSRRTGHEHPHAQGAFANYAGLLQKMGKPQAEIEAAINLLVNPPR